MATLILDRRRLRHNYEYLQQLFEKHHEKWAVVTKLLCGNRLYLEELLSYHRGAVCDSRVRNLKQIKEISPNTPTIFIKPPANNNIQEVVRYADYSFNTELSTIELLNAEAERQGKVHHIIIAIELGELREGVMGEELMAFYRKAFTLPHIEVAGVAANLSCLYGVLPTTDKLIQVSLYAQLIEATFGKKLELVSGGSSVSIPLLMNNTLPKGINHFRVGETLYFGTNVYDDTRIEGMEYDVFQLFVNVLEVTEKPMTPTGEFGTNLEGKTFEPDTSLLGQTSIRAIVDIGVLDVDVSQISFIDEQIKIAGATSDMVVLDLGTNRKGYKPGDQIGVRLNYMSALKLLNSQYIVKEIV